MQKRLKNQQKTQVSKKTGKRVKKRWKSQIAGLCNADGSTGVEVEIGR